MPIFYLSLSTDDMLRNVIKRNLQGLIRLTTFTSSIYGISLQSTTLRMTSSELVMRADFGFDAEEGSLGVVADERIQVIINSR